MYVEITAEAFRALVGIDTKASEVMERESFRDLIYYTKGVKVVHRYNHISGVSYHIMDINA